MLTGAMTQDSQLLGVTRKLLGMSLVPKLCHPVLRAFVCSSPWCKCHALLCSLCWASAGLLLGPAVRKAKNNRALHLVFIRLCLEHRSTGLGPSIRTLLVQKVASAQLPACRLVGIGFQRVL